MNKHRILSTALSLALLVNGAAVASADGGNRSERAFLGTIASDAAQNPEQFGAKNFGEFIQGEQEHLATEHNMSLGEFFSYIAKNATFPDLGH